MIKKEVPDCVRVSVCVCCECVPFIVRGGGQVVFFKAAHGD